MSRALAAESGAGTVLTLFWKLAETDSDERLGAASDLIDILVAQQQQHTPAAAAVLQHPAGDEADLLEYDQHGSAAFSDAQEARAERIVDALCTPDVAYSLRRLIRGLASPRQGARQGFAVALAELLSRLSQIIPLAPDVVLTLILRASVSSRSMKPAEARELLFARLFGIHTLFRSRIIFQDDDIDNEATAHGGIDGNEAEEVERVSQFRVMPGSNLRVFERTLDILFSNVATYKSWIRQSATWLGQQAIEGLLHIDSADLSWRDEAIEIFYSRVASAVSDSRLDMDTLAFVISLSPVLSAEKLKSLLCPPFASSNLLAPANLPALGRIVKELPLEDDADPKTGTTSSWTPDLHLVWDQLLDIYYPPAGATTSALSLLRTGAAPFADFFRVLVDDTLFAPTSSPERKSWGFTLVQRILTRLGAKTNAAERIRDVPLLFQPNFVRTWINQLSEPSRMLHKAARRTAHVLNTTLQNSPAPAEQRSLTAFALLTILLNPPVGIRAFDKVTKTRTIEHILGTLDGSGLDRYVAFLEGEILGSGEPAQAETEEDGSLGGGASGRRRWAIDQLLGVIRFRAPTAGSAAPSAEAEGGSQKQQAGPGGLRDEAVALRVLRFLLTHGWFEPAHGASADKKKAKKGAKQRDASSGAAVSSASGASLDASTRALLRSRFLSSLQDLNSLTTLRTEPDGKKHRVQGVLSSEDELWVSKAWAFVKELEADADWRSVAIPLPQGHGHEHEHEDEGEEPADEAEVAEAFTQARGKVEDVLKALRKLRVKAAEKAKNAPDRTELERVRGLEAALVGTLLYCYDSRTDAGELLEPLADATLLLLGLTAQSGEDEAQPDEAFVDALLNLLNRPTAFLRSLASQAFGASSDLITAAGLQLLFESLVPSDGDAMDEDEVAEDGAEEDGESEDDDDQPEGEDEDADDDASDSDTSADSEADSDIDAEVDPELRSKVLKALQASGIADVDGKAGSDGDDSDAESDITMLDDEQMMKLDDKLASIFRTQLKGKNAAGADEHKEALAQQNKILDLLETFASRQAGSPLALTLVHPLLNVMQMADKDSKQVANRAATILRLRLGSSANKAAAAAATAAAAGAASSTSNGVLEVDALVADLEQVHAVVCEVTEPEHVAACTSASALLSRTLLAQKSAAATAAVARVHAHSVDAFFRRRGARVKPNFLREALVRNPLVGWEVRGALLDVLESAREGGEREKKMRPDYVKQLQPLMQVMLGNSLQLSEVNPAEAAAFLTKVNDLILGMLRDAVAVAAGESATIPSSSVHRVKVLREVLKIAQQTGKCAQRLGDGDGGGGGGSMSPDAICNLSGWESAFDRLPEAEKTGPWKALVGQVQQYASSLRTLSGKAAAGAKNGDAKPKAKEQGDDGVKAGAGSSAAVSTKKSGGGSQKKVESGRDGRKAAKPSKSDSASSSTTTTTTPSLDAPPPPPPPVVRKQGKKQKASGDANGGARPEKKAKKVPTSG